MKEMPRNLFFLNLSRRFIYFLNKFSIFPGKAKLRKQYSHWSSLAWTVRGWFMSGVKLTFLWRKFQHWADSVQEQGQVQGHRVLSSVSAPASVRVACLL